MINDIPRESFYIIMSITEIPTLLTFLMLSQIIETSINAFVETHAFPIGVYQDFNNIYFIQIIPKDYLKFILNKINKIIEECE